MAYIGISLSIGNPQKRFYDKRCTYITYQSISPNLPNIIYMRPTDTQNNTQQTKRKQISFLYNICVYS